MDIYKYAEENNWNADYYDIHTGYIYGIQEAGRLRKFFGIEAPIKVYTADGKCLGEAKKGEVEV